MPADRDSRRSQRFELLAAAFVVAWVAAPQPARATDHLSAEADTRTVVFAGDIVLGGAINALAAEHGAAALLEEVPELREADLAIANLESVATTHDLSRADKGGLVPFHFRARPETLGVLGAAGIDVVATANNHSGDYGPDALLEQHGLLEELGIAHAGSGPTQADACAPIYLDAGDGVRVAFFSADATEASFDADVGAGTCHFDIGNLAAWEEQFAAPLALAREQAHAIFFAVHWGENFVAEPSDEKRALGGRLIELGADAILGTNAHQLQGLEAHGDGVIVHDAAHLLADFEQPVDTAVFTFRVSKAGLEGVEATPLVADTGRARRPSPSEADRILGDLTRMSAALGVTLDDGQLHLTPDPETPKSVPPNLVAPRSGTAPAPATSPPPSCLTADVPDHARIAPLDLGPLTLIGFSVDHDRTYLPGLVWVDTYWRVAEPVSDPMWIAITGTDGDASSAWTSHHEPCDWAWPTTRWHPGVIYHDRSALRPSAGTVNALGAARIASGLLGSLEVTVGVTRDGDEVARSGRVGSVGLGAPLAVQLLVAAGVAALGLAAGRRAWRRLQERAARGERAGAGDRST